MSLMRSLGWLAAFALVAAPIVVLVSCGSDQIGEPAPCRKTGTIVLDSSNYFTLELEISGRFVFALQGADDEIGVPQLSLARFRDDLSKVERFLPEHGVIPFVRAYEDGAWFVVRGITWGPDDSIEGFWAEVWEWPDGDTNPKKRLGNDWSINAIQPWDNDLIVFRSELSGSSLIRVQVDGTWESMHEFPSHGWAAMTVAGDHLAVLPHFMDETKGRVTWFGKNGQVIRESEPTNNLAFAPIRLEAVGDYLYAFRSGEQHPDLGGRPMYAAVFEFGPDGAVREVFDWSNRYGQIAANSTQLFIALEGEDPLASDGVIYVQEDQGQELIPFREGIRGVYALAADDEKLVYSRSRPEEPVYQLELTYLPGDSALPACE